ncbi:helix-turn-helix domain-containing protein [Glutamicibacter mishrai]|uniref:TetR/AcrR family transcriptional regulator n=1 Tax=Glutamicibacter mishrai TaxID=1775880 RepID=UPI0032EF1A25
MSRHSDKAREVLLDAAEELFALHGIDAVSNRKITEHAGTANHSAIKYHFGSRADLLRAMVQRAVGDVYAIREKLPLNSDVSALNLREQVTLYTLPLVYSFDALPKPSWRAKFLFQALLRPDLTDVLAGLVDEDFRGKDFPRRLPPELEGLPDVVISARAKILGLMLLGLCAEYEDSVNEGEQLGTWESVGYFLIDSAVGMMAAPSTSPADFMDFSQR